MIDIFIINILPEYISYKKYFYLLFTCKHFYKNKLSEKILSNIYYTPLTRMQLYKSINRWCSNKKLTKATLRDINEWNTRYICDMSYLFYCEIHFNDNIEDWIVYNVKNMDYMFYCALSFNKPLNNWNVSNVKTMNSTFNSAKTFNKPLDKWNIKNVNSMNYIFANAVNFNRNLKQVICDAIETQGYFLMYKMEYYKLPILI